MPLLDLRHRHSPRGGRGNSSLHPEFPRHRDRRVDQPTRTIPPKVIGRKHRPKVFGDGDGFVPRTQPAAGFRGRIPRAEYSPQPISLGERRRFGPFGVGLVAREKGEVELGAEYVLVAVAEDRLLLRAE